MISVRYYSLLASIFSLAVAGFEFMWSMHKKDIVIMWRGSGDRYKTAMRIQ